MSDARKSTRRSSKLALLPLTGAALVLATASPASGIIEAKGVLGWGIWASEGINGSTVTVANVEGNLANWNHRAIDQQILVNLVWPFEPNGTVMDTMDRSTKSNHATATASAIVGVMSGVTAIEGVAPKANIINSAFADGVDQNGAFIVDLTSLGFALYAPTDQALADEVAEALNIQPYPAATIVNASVTRRNQQAHQTIVTGEDAFTRSLDSVATTTGALVIAPAGDLGDVQELDSQDRGTIAPPGSGFNAIAVGFTDTSLQPSEDTSEGPQVASDWRVSLGLVDPMAQPPIGGDQEDFPNSPDAMEEVEDARPGPDIIAPGENIRLAGSIAASPEDNNAFSSFWTGSSISCAIVAGAAALVQDAGNKRGLWNGERPSALVTKAVILNSADKDGFNNMGMNGDPPAPPFNPNDETDIWITDQALDAQIGAGLLDFNRLYNQFVLAKFADYENIPGLTIDPETLQYTIPAVGPRPGVPFVTRQNPLRDFEGPDFVPGGGDDGGPGGPGGNMTAMSHTHTDDPLLTEILDQAAIFRDVYPAQLGGPSPDLDGGGGVGVDFPSRPIWRPRFPVGRPPIPPNCAQCPQFRTGWDEGQVGWGYIDFDLGFVTPGSTITATLCWNRHLKWSVPDFAGPLNFIETEQAAPGADDLGIRLDSAQQRGAGFDPIDMTKTNGGPAPLALREEAKLRRAFNPRQVPINAEVDRIHVVTNDGLCNDLHSLCNHDDLRGAHHHVDGDLRERLDELFEAQRNREVTVQAGANPLRGVGGFDIIYNLSPEVAANPDFVAALNTAAAVWEEVISDPVTVFVDVSFTSNQGFIAAALSTEFAIPYSQVRGALISDANFAERNVMQALPSTARWNTSAGTFTSGTIVGVGVPRANAKALNFDVGSPTDSDSLIIFNTDFTYDNDPTDGVSPDDIDTVAVMAHEIGHMLGFVSDAEATQFNGFSIPSVLDIFRFPIIAGEDPNTLTDFMSFAREITVGAEAAIDTANGISGIGQAFRMSTGASFPGDGRQASHWIDDQRTGAFEYVGVMDPTYFGPEGPGGGIPEAPEGELPDYLTSADLLAFSLIGWDIEFDTDLPPSMQVPDIGVRALPGFVSTVPDPEIEWAFDNLDLELYLAGDGSGTPDIPVAYSRTLWNNVESFFVGADAGGGEEQVPAGNYFIRVRHVETRYDLGGTVDFDFPTVVVDPYLNIPQAQIDYGMAWYIDLARTNEEFITEDLRAKSDLNGDGVINGGDLSILIAQFGKDHPAADLDDDGKVGSSDLATLLSFYGDEL